VYKRQIYQIAESNRIETFFPNWNALLQRPGPAGRMEIFMYTERSKGSPYSITEHRVPELIPVLSSQPAGDVTQRVNRGTTGVNSLPKTVTLQHRGCDLNPGPSAPESSTLTTRLPSHPYIHCHCVPKNDTDVGCYNFNVYHPIWDFFAEMLLRE